MTPVARQIQHAVQPALVDAVVIPVANLPHVEREIPLADVVKLTDDRHDRLERLNRVGVSRAETGVKRLVALGIAARRRLSRDSCLPENDVIDHLIDLEKMGLIKANIDERGGIDYQLNLKKKGARAK